MLNGIVAATKLPQLLPYAGSYLAMDFVSNFYSINGTQVTINDVIDHPEIRTASGLVMDWWVETQFVVSILSTAASAIDFANGWTALIDFDQYDAVGYTYKSTVLQFWNGVDYNSNPDVFGVYASGSLINPWAAKGTSFSRGFNISHALADGARRRYAMTVTPDRLSFCFNGGSVSTDTTGTWATPSFTSYTIGSYAGDVWYDINAVYKSIVFYPPIQDALLPSYTTV